MEDESGDKLSEIAKHFEKKNISKRKKYCNNEEDEAEAVGKAEEI